MTKCRNCKTTIATGRKFCCLDCVYQMMHKTQWGRRPRPKIKLQNAKLRKLWNQKEKKPLNTDELLIQTQSLLVELIKLIKTQRVRV